MQETIVLFFLFSENTSLEISCESSAEQMIHMKCQDLFSLKIEKKYFRMLSVTNFAWHFQGLQEHSFTSLLFTSLLYIL